MNKYSNVKELWDRNHFRNLGSIHTFDLLGLHYCVKFLAHAITKNGYTIHYWTFQYRQKFTK